MAKTWWGQSILLKGLSISLAALLLLTLNGPKETTYSPSRISAPERLTPQHLSGPQAQVRPIGLITNQKPESRQPVTPTQRWVF